jgi:hypothetical protein
MMLRGLFSVVCLFPSLVLSQDFEQCPGPPYTVEKIKSWQQHVAPRPQDWPWPSQPEYEVQLRSDDSKQLLLCFCGGARSGEYVLFQLHEDNYIVIGEDIRQAHHPVLVLQHTVDGWHDFRTFLPLWGSGGEEVYVVTYRWQGSRYIELSSSSGMWCDYEPFKSDHELCSG